MDTYEAARSVLPAWIGWVPALVVVLLAAALGLLSSFVGERIAMRPLRALDPAATWQERARLAYPVRVFSGSNAVLPAALAGSLALGFKGPLSSLPGAALIVLATLAAAVPGFWMRLRTEREIRRIPLSAGRWIRGGLVLVLLTMPHLFLALVLNFIMPSELGVRAFAILGAGTAVAFYLLRGGVLDVARLFGLARPASPRLTAIVDSTSAKAGIRPSAVFELLCPWANAYAYPLSGRLAFTDQALEDLSDEEVAAVCAHELGHIAEPRAVAATRVSGAFAFFLAVALAKPIVATGGVNAFAFTVLGAYVLAMFLRRLFVRMEARADKVAHAHEGDAGTYARALTRIHESNLLPVVMLKGRGVHPSLYDRVAAAGAPFLFPRPAPPPRARALAATCVAAAIVAAGFVGTKEGLLFSADGLTEKETTGALFAAAAYGGDQRALAALARLRASRGDVLAALTLYRAAASTGWIPPADVASIAVALALAGHCDEAVKAAETADALLEELGEGSNETRDTMPETTLVEGAWEAVRVCNERAGKMGVEPPEDSGVQEP